MTKVLVVGYGDKNTASTRFRFLRCVPALAEHGVCMQVYYRADIADAGFRAALDAADVVVNQKILMSASEGRAIITAGKPLVFDFDDAIWTRPGKPYDGLTGWRVARRARFWLSKAAHVTVANNYLAEFAAKTSSRVSVIPMALASNQLLAKKTGGTTITIGWMGSPGNLHCLERLGPTLRYALDRNPDLSLRVFCGKRPDLPVEYDWVDFNPTQEQAFATSLDIGLLPLPDDEYSKGKSPIKALYYMNAGAVVVGNVRGASADLLDASRAVPIQKEDDWVPALLALAGDPNRREGLRQAAKKFVQQRHSMDSIVRRMAAIYRDLAQNQA